MNDNHNQPLTLRLLTKYLRKVGFRDGDVMLVRTGTLLGTKEMIDFIADSMTNMGYTKAVVIAVDDFDDLRILNEIEMGKHGWFRIQTLSSLVSRSKND